MVVEIDGGSSSSVVLRTVVGAEEGRMGREGGLVGREEGLPGA